jgi:hypothetical protein
VGTYCFILYQELKKVSAHALHIKHIHLTISPIAGIFKYGKENRPFTTKKQRKGRKCRPMGCGYFRSYRCPYRLDFRYRHPDYDDEGRYIMTISKNTLLNFALSCFIFSTLVFAVLFF